MNICLLFACMTVLPVLTGKGVLAILYRKQARKFYIAEGMIVGWLVVIGLAQAAHLAAVFLGWSLRKVTVLFAVGCSVIAVVGALVGLAGAKAGKGADKRSRKPLTMLSYGLITVWILLSVWQIMTIVSQESVYRVGDMTVETVESFLQTDGIHAVNPLTGRAYEAGIPFRIKILGLPTLYAMLCNLFGIAPTELVWRVIPVGVLLLSYCAFWMLGKTLFDSEKEGEKRLLFMALTALLFCVGDYVFGMDGFGLLHCGYRGVTIRNMVLIPYAFFLGLRKNWRVALLVVLAEACIAWTFYGMGMSLVVLAGMAVISLFQKKEATGLRSVQKEA